MQISDSLALTHAQISAIAIRQKEGAFTNRVHIRAQLTPELAVLLGCRDIVFTDTGIAKEVFTSVMLDTECKAFRALFEVDDLQQTYEMNGDSITDIVVEKRDAGNLRVTLRLNWTGDPLHFIAYWGVVGEALGHCTISPLARELEAAAEVESAQLVLTSRDGERTAIHVPKETLRHAMAASRPTPSTRPFEDAATAKRRTGKGQVN